MLYRSIQKYKKRILSHHIYMLAMFRQKMKLDIPIKINQQGNYQKALFNIFVTNITMGI